MVGLSGYGDGSGGGSGSGSGDGGGYGSGSGSGSGDGSGSGYGDGYSDGYGDGYGYGDGGGSGYGSGSGGGSGDGSGDGPELESVGGHAVRWIERFSVLRVGCEVRELSDWLANAEAIDEKHGDGIAAKTRALAERLQAEASR